MSGVNKVILIGRLGSDPEIRYTPSGSAIANVSIATSESWKDRETGEKKEKTEWHRVVFFNRLAEIVGEYLGKGDQVYVEGSLQTRKWQDKQGGDRYTTEIVARNMQMLGGGASGGASVGERRPANTAAPSAGKSAASAPPADDDFDDDIPF